MHDVAIVHEKMMHETDAKGLYNLGTGKTNNVEEIAKLIAEKYNAKIEYIDMPSKLKGQYQEYTCADNAKLHNTIAMRHWHTIEEYFNGTD